jgi:hypothetical protein
MFRAAVILTFGLALLATPALAQTPCKERTQVLQELQTRFAEKPIAAGLLNEKSVVEVLTSGDGTWTILVTHTNGMSCLVASGESWVQVASDTAARDSRKDFADGPNVAFR